MFDDIRLFRAACATRDPEGARLIAQRYIDQHWDEVAPHLGHLSIEDLVALVSAYRAAGRIDDSTVADMWIMARLPRQHITGELHVRMPSLTSQN